MQEASRVMLVLAYPLAVSLGVKQWVHSLNQDLPLAKEKDQAPSSCSGSMSWLDEWRDQQQERSSLQSLLLGAGDTAWGDAAAGNGGGKRRIGECCGDGGWRRHLPSIAYSFVRVTIKDMQTHVLYYLQWFQEREGPGSQCWDQGQTLIHPRLIKGFPRQQTVTGS